MNDQPSGAPRPAAEPVRSYRTRFRQDEDPLSEGGIWINGRTDGIDWVDVVARNGVAYGGLSRMAVAERRVQQGNLEQANVEAVTEISDLIAAQRAYEMNAKVITAADQMLSATSNLMR